MKLPALVLLLHGLTGAQTQTLQPRVEQLEKTIESLTQKLKALEFTLDLDRTLAKDLFQLDLRSVTFDLQSTRFSVIGQRGLHLAVAYSRAEAHLSGIRLWLKAAPLGSYCATDTSFTFEVGKAAPKDNKAYSVWRKELRETTIQTTEHICPGKWTELSFAIPSFKPEDFGYLRAGVEITGISPVTR